MTSPLALQRFLEILRKNGFSIGVDDRIELTRLFREELDWDLPRLRAIVAAVVCSSPEERARYDRLFDAFFCPKLPIEPPPAPRPRPNYLVWGFVAAFALLLALSAAALGGGAGRDDSSAAGTGRRPVTSHAPAPVTAAQPLSPGVSQSSGGKPGSRRAISEDWIARRNLLGAAWMGLCVAAVTAWLLVRRRTRRYPRLQGPFTFEPDYPVQGNTPSGELSLLDDVASALGRRTGGAARSDLDVVKTIERSARSALPMPVWRLAARPPRYLVLLDESPRFRELGEEILSFCSALQARGVRLESYAFEDRPERLWPAGEPGAAHAISDLAGRSIDGLLVLGDPDAARLTGEGGPAKWLSAVAGIARKVWLHPTPSMELSPGAAVLRDAGFRLSLPESRGFFALAAGSAGVEPELVAPPVTSAVDYYRRFLGQAFPLLCASALLPALSARGVRWLRERLDLTVPFDALSRLLGIGWVTDGAWPRELRQSLLETLRQEDPRLFGKARAATEQHLDEAAPEAGSGAWYRWRMAKLEHAVHRRDATAAALYRELRAGPMFVRATLERSQWLEEWLAGIRGESRRRSGLVVLGTLGTLLLAALVWIRMHPSPAPVERNDALPPTAPKLPAPDPASTGTTPPSAPTTDDAGVAAADSATPSPSAAPSSSATMPRATVATPPKPPPKPKTFACQALAVSDRSRAALTLRERERWDAFCTNTMRRTTKEEVPGGDILSCSCPWGEEPPALSSGKVEDRDIDKKAGEEIVPPWQGGGLLPSQDIQRIARQNMARFRTCYEEGLRRNPALRGRVATKFVIGRDGTVTASQSAPDSTLPDEKVRNCVADQFRRVRFPENPDGPSTVLYPLYFEPEAEASPEIRQWEHAK